MPRCSGDSSSRGRGKHVVLHLNEKTRKTNQKQDVESGSICGDGSSYQTPDDEVKIDQKVMLPKQSYRGDCGHCGYVAHSLTAMEKHILQHANGVTDEPLEDKTSEAAESEGNCEDLLPDPDPDDDHEWKEMELGEENEPGFEQREFEDPTEGHHMGTCDMDGDFFRDLYEYDDQETKADTHEFFQPESEPVACISELSLQEDSTEEPQLASQSDGSEDPQRNEREVLYFCGHCDFQSSDLGQVQEHTLAIHKHEPVEEDSVLPKENTTWKLEVDEDYESDELKETIESTSNIDTAENRESAPSDENGKEELSDQPSQDPSAEGPPVRCRFVPIDDCEFSTDPKFQCAFLGCPMVYKDRSELVDHVLASHNGLGCKLFYCAYCKFAATDCESVREHTHNMHNVDRNSIFLNLSRYQREVTFNEGLSDSSKEMYRCLYCDFHSEKMPVSILHNLHSHREIWMGGLEKIQPGFRELTNRIGIFKSLPTLVEPIEMKQKDAVDKAKAGERNEKNNSERDEDESLCEHGDSETDNLTPTGHTVISDRVATEFSVSRSFNSKSRRTSGRANCQVNYAQLVRAGCPNGAHCPGCRFCDKLVPYSAGNSRATLTKVTVDGQGNKKLLVTIVKNNTGQKKSDSERKRESQSEKMSSVDKSDDDDSRSSNNSTSSAAPGVIEYIQDYEDPCADGESNTRPRSNRKPIIVSPFRQNNTTFFKTSSVPSMPRTQPPTYLPASSGTRLNPTVDLGNRNILGKLLNAAPRVTLQPSSFSSSSVTLTTTQSTSVSQSLPRDSPKVVSPADQQPRLSANEEGARVQNEVVTKNTTVVESQIPLPVLTPSKPAGLIGSYPLLVTTAPNALPITQLSTAMVPTLLHKSYPSNVSDHTYIISNGTATQIAPSHVQGLSSVAPWKPLEMNSQFRPILTGNTKPINENPNANFIGMLRPHIATTSQTAPPQILVTQPLAPKSNQMTVFPSGQPVQVVPCSSQNMNSISLNLGTQLLGQLHTVNTVQPKPTLISSDQRNMQDNNKPTNMIRISPTDLCQNTAQNSSSSPGTVPTFHVIQPQGVLQKIQPPPNSLTQTISNNGQPIYVIQRQPQNPPKTDPLHPNSTVINSPNMQGLSSVASRSSLEMNPKQVNAITPGTPVGNRSILSSASQKPVIVKPLSDIKSLLQNAVVNKRESQGGNTAVSVKNCSPVTLANNSPPTPVNNLRIMPSPKCSVKRVVRPLTGNQVSSGQPKVIITSSKQGPAKPMGQSVNNAPASTVDLKTNTNKGVKPGQHVVNIGSCDRGCKKHQLFMLKDPATQANRFWVIHQLKDDNRVLSSVSLDLKQPNSTSSNNNRASIVAGNSQTPKGANLAPGGPNSDKSFKIYEDGIFDAMKSREGKMGFTAPGQIKENPLAFDQSLASTGLLIPKEKRTPVPDSAVPDTPEETPQIQDSAISSTCAKEPIKIEPKEDKDLVDLNNVCQAGNKTDATSKSVGSKDNKVETAIKAEKPECKQEPLESVSGQNNHSERTAVSQGPSVSDDDFDMPCGDTVEDNSFLYAGYSEEDWDMDSFNHGDGNSETSCGFRPLKDYLEINSQRKGKRKRKAHDDPDVKGPRKLPEGPVRASKRERKTNFKCLCEECRVMRESQLMVRNPRPQSKKLDDPKLKMKPVVLLPDISVLLLGLATEMDL